MMGRVGQIRRIVVVMLVSAMFVTSSIFCFIFGVLLRKTDSDERQTPVKSMCG